MKKILVSAYLAQNFGDDLFLKVLFDRYKNVQWVLDSYNDTYKDIFNEYDNVSNINTFKYKVFKKLNLEKIYFNSFDGAILIGGSVFIELDNWKEKLDYRKNKYKYLVNKPKFILGSNFGPYKSDEFYEAYKQLFKESTDVCFRETHSYELFKDIDNVRIAPDIVFQLNHKPMNKIKNSLGLSVIDLTGRKNLEKYKDTYIKKVKEIIVEAVDRKQDVYMFSFCKKEGDEKAINDILDEISNDYKNKIKVIKYEGNIDEFLEVLGSMETVIGTRFHSCILSQVFNQGLYPIIYSDKTYNMLKDINLSDYYTYIEDLENIDVKHILDVVANNKISSNGIFSEAERQFEVLDEYLK